MPLKPYDIQRWLDMMERQTLRPTKMVSMRIVLHQGDRDAGWILIHATLVNVRTGEELKTWPAYWIDVYDGYVYTAAGDERRQRHIDTIGRGDTK